ncbi:MAG: SLC13 family permease [Myxococcota bacterium]
MYGRIGEASALLLALGALGLGASGHLQAWLHISPPAAVTLAVLVMAAVLWVSELVPLFVTSFLILFLNVVWVRSSLEAEGQAVSAAAFTSPFFSDVILLFLGGFVLSAAFHRYGLDERIARTVLEKTGGAPSRVLAGVMLTTAFLSMWMSNTATTAMMLGLTGPIIARIEASDPFRKALALGIPFAANLGGLGTPIGTPPNAIAVQFMSESGIAPSFATWMAMAAPMLIILLALAWILLMRLHPARAEAVSMPEGSGFDIDRRGVGVLAVALLTIAGWLTSSLHGLSTGIVALLPVLVFFGLRLLDARDFRQLPWDVLILAGGGLSLGRAAALTGLADAAASLVPVDEGLFAVALGFGLVASLMSTFMSNTATANLLIPVALGLPAGLASSVLCVVAFSCSVSMALPVTTPPNAMAFSSGNIVVRDMIAPGGLLTVAGIVAAVVSMAWWKLLGAV